MVNGRVTFLPDFFLMRVSQGVKCKFPVILPLEQRQQLPRTTQAGHARRREKLVLPALTHHPPLVITECVCVRERDRNRHRHRDTETEERLVGGGFLLDRAVDYCLVPTATSPSAQRGETKVSPLHFRVEGLGDCLASLCLRGPWARERQVSPTQCVSPAPVEGVALS